MKATIKELGGRVIEFEGTAYEIREALGWGYTLQAPYVPEPISIPTPFFPPYPYTDPYPWYNPNTPYTPPTITFTEILANDGQAPVSSHQEAYTTNEAPVYRKDSVSRFYKSCS